MKKIFTNGYEDGLFSGAEGLAYSIAILLIVACIAGIGLSIFGLYELYGLMHHVT
jgi:hypothetical protein